MTDLISVLIVDDEEYLLTASTEWLNRSGDLSVIGVTRASEAIELMKARKFDIIISDYLMSGMNGIEFLKHLKAAGDPTPFILFTGKSREDIAIEALNNGAAFYLQKEGSSIAVFAELESKIRAAVSHSRAIEELDRMNMENREHIAALRRSEENLKKTTDLLENLIHIAQNPILVWDPSFHIIRLNHACERLIGRPAEEVIGSPIDLLFSPEQADRTRKLVQAIQDGARWETSELDLMHQDGSVRNILWNTSTLYNADGTTPVATIAQGSDITEELRLKIEKDTALEQIQKNLAQLAILNDGIRNPLTVILMCVDDLGTGESVGQIISQTQRIDEMVNTLDRRWVESEKILHTIRKHYQIDPSLVSDYRDETEADQPDLSKKEHLLIEEINARLFTILDSIDAFVYVADMETFEILYVNQQGRAKLGNIIGERCFKVFHPGLEKPCQFCTNMFLTCEGKPTGVHRWEFHSEEDGRWYDCRDRAIRWNDGRLVHLTISTDITERRESEARFRSYIDNAPEGIFLADENGNYTFVNGAACDTTGYSREELLQKNLIELIYPEDIQNAGEHFRKTVETGNASGELRFVTKAGNIRWWTVKAVQLSPVQFLGFTSDITERKQVEENLIQSEAQKSAILSGITTNIALVDRDLRILWANKAAAVSVQKQPGDLVGHQCFSFWGDSVKPCENCPTIRAFQSRQSEHTTVYTPDGRIWDERGEPIFDPDGNVSYVVEIAQDITERKRAEEALKESEERHRTILKTAMDGFMIVDSSGRLIEVNEAYCNMSGYTQEEFLCMGINDLEEAETSAETAAHIQRIMAQGADRFESRHRRKDGSLFDVEVSVQNRSEDEMRFIVFLRDITDQKRADEEMKIRGAAMESSISGIALSDKDGKINYVNEAWLKMFGYDSPEEVIGTAPFNHVKNPPQINNILQILKTESRWVGELICHRRDGSSFPIELLTNTVTDSSGRILCLLASFLDITERKLAEAELFHKNEELHEAYEQISATNEELLNNNEELEKSEDALRMSEERLKLAHLATNDVVWDWDVLSDTQQWNEAGTKVFGWTEIVEKPVNAQWWVDRVHPDDRDRIHENFFAVVDDPTADFWRDEYRFLKTDGSYADVIDRGYVLRDQEGRAYRMVGAMLDITERKRAEMALRESQMLISCSQEIAHIGSWILDIHSNRLTWSDEVYRIFGLRPQEFAATYEAFLNAVHPDDRIAVDTAYSTSVQRGKDTYEIEHRIIRKDTGEIRYVHERCIHERDKSGLIVRSIGMVQDITERMLSEEALRHSEMAVRTKLKAILEPEGDLLDLKLGDIIDVPFLQSMMDDFYKLTRIGIAIIDLKGEILVATGWQDICTKFHRIHPDTLKNCLESDCYLTQDVTPGEYRVYKCKNHMWDMVTPIMIGKNHMGNLFLGQFFFEGEDIEENLFLKQAEQYGFDTKAYLAALENVPRWSKATVHTVMNFYTQLTRVISQMSYSNLKLAKSLSDQKNIEISLRLSEGELIQKNEDLNDICEKLERSEEELKTTIEELYQIENSLRDSQEKFRLIAENSLDSIWTLGPDLRFTYLSPSTERLFGYTIQEWEQLEWNRFVHPDYLTIVTDFFEEVFAGKEGPVKSLIIPVTHKNGNDMWVEFSASPIRDSDNHLTGIVGITRDITERKQAEEALFASNQRLRLLTSLTRHDVTNKLAATHLFQEIASEESDPEKQKEFLRRASQATGEAEAIISFTKEYEDFGVVASGWQQVESLIMQAASEIVHSGILIRTTIPPDLEIFADPIIMKVFFTLIENAVRHTSTLTWITFSCLKEGRSIIIVCEDDGCGIPYEEKGRIFDHGYGKNTGLGLFLAREILSITGLSIRETGDPGKGARFEILVPEGKWRRTR